MTKCFKKKNIPKEKPKITTASNTQSGIVFSLEGLGFACGSYH